jgi:uncharacterized protein DUF4365
MAGKIFGPRKRRTRQHVIADLSVHHVEGFILDEGHTAQHELHDYGYDLVMRTYDVDGYVEPDIVLFQVKASERLEFMSGFCSYDVQVRDYNLWIAEKMPVILTLYDASRRQAFWLDFKRFFHDNPMQAPGKRARWVRVRLSISQELNRPAIAEMRRMKSELVNVKIV